MEIEFVYLRNTLRALRSSFNICPCISDRAGIWQCWFLRRGENRGIRIKSSRSKERTNNKLKPYMTPGLGIETGPHWWEASALTTAPPLERNPWPNPLSSIANPMIRMLRSKSKFSNRTHFSFIKSPFISFIAKSVCRHS